MPATLSINIISSSRYKLKVLLWAVAKACIDACMCAHTALHVYRHSHARDRILTFTGLKSVGVLLIRTIALSWCASHLTRMCRFSKQLDQVRSRKIRLIKSNQVRFLGPTLKSQLCICT